MHDFDTIVEEYETQVGPIGEGCYNIGFFNEFNVEDETQIHLDEQEGVRELKMLWFDFCDEFHFEHNSIRYIEKFQG